MVLLGCCAQDEVKIVSRKRLETQIDYWIVRIRTSSTDHRSRPKVISNRHRAGAAKRPRLSLTKEYKEQSTHQIAGGGYIPSLNARATKAAESSYGHGAAIGSVGTVEHYHSAIWPRIWQNREWSSRNTWGRPYAAMQSWHFGYAIITAHYRQKLLTERPASLISSYIGSPRQQTPSHAAFRKINND